MPVPWERFARAIADRSFSADYQFMLGTNKVSATSSSPAPGATTGPPGGEALPPGANPQYGGAAAVGAGPLAGRIVAMARSLVGNLNGVYYALDNKNACASFVSTVLIRSGAVVGREQIEGAGFTRSAALLTQTTERAGAVSVFAAPLPLTPANVLLAQPGDVVQFLKPGQTPHHSGIANGEGRVVATSSQAGAVSIYSMLALRGRPGHERGFDRFQLHRFTR